MKDFAGEAAEAVSHKFGLSAHAGILPHLVADECWSFLQVHV